MKKYAEQNKAKKKNTKKLEEGLKNSIFGPQNMGLGGLAPGSDSSACRRDGE